MESVMKEFQKKAKSHENAESIADMKNFVEASALFKNMSGRVTKHVTVIGDSALVTDPSAGRLRAGIASTGTQYSPLLKDTLEDLINGNLREPSPHAWGARSSPLSRGRHLRGVVYTGQPNEP